MPPISPQAAWPADSVDLTTLLQLFYRERSEDLASFEPVDGESLAAPYRRLLDHDEHMTITVEAFHDSPVDVRICRSLHSDACGNPLAEDARRSEAHGNTQLNGQGNTQHNIQGDAQRNGQGHIQQNGQPLPSDNPAAAAAPAELYSREIVLVAQKSRKVVQYGIVRLRCDLLQPAVWQEIRAGQTPLGRVLIHHNVFRQVELIALWKVTAGPALAKQLGMPQGAITYGRTARIFCDGEPAIELLEIVAPV